MLPLKADLKHSGSDRIKLPFILFSCFGKHIILVFRGLHTFTGDIQAVCIVLERLKKSILPQLPRGCLSWKLVRYLRLFRIVPGIRSTLPCSWLKLLINKGTKYRHLQNIKPSSNFNISSLWQDLAFFWQVTAF